MCECYLHFKQHSYFPLESYFMFVSSCTCSLCLKLLVMLRRSERCLQSVTLCFQRTILSALWCAVLYVLISINHTLNHFCLYHLIKKLKNNCFEYVIFKNIKWLYLENKTVSLILMWVWINIVLMSPNLMRLWSALITATAITCSQTDYHTNWGMS